MKFILIFSLCIYSCYIEAQDKVIDSLNAALKNAKHDTTRAKICNDLFEASDEKDMLPHAEKALSIVNANPNPKNEKEKLSFQSSKAKALGNIAYFHLISGNNSEALEYFKQSLNIFLELGDKKSLATTYSNMAFVYQNMSNYPEALDHFQKAQNYRKETDDKLSYAMGLRHIAMINSTLGKYKESLNYNFESLKLYEELKDKGGIAASYNDIGHSFGIQQDIPKAIEFAQKALDIYKTLGQKSSLARSYMNLGYLTGIHIDAEKGIAYVKQGLEIFEKIGEKKGVASCLAILGGIYEAKGRYEEALEVQKKSLDIYTSIHSGSGIASSNFGVGNTLLKMNKTDEALSFAKISLETSQKIKQPKEVFKAAQLLNKIYKQKGDFKSALAMYELYVSTRDSLVNDDIKKATLQKQFTYEFDKKEALLKADQEKKDALNAEAQHRQKILMISIIIVLLLICIITLVIYRSLRQNKKAHRIIKHQKEEVEKQKEIIEEKQMEIVDSINYAKRIQTALLAGAKTLEENLPEHFVMFQPKDIVSGDFYWTHTLPNGNFALVTADSTGHGVPGAIMSMLNISCLTEAIEGRNLTEPNDILNFTRNRIIKHLSNDGSATGGKDGMDCSLISFDFQNNILTYAAANNPIWLVRLIKGTSEYKLIELDPDKMPVGKHDKDSVSFLQHSLELQKGDIVYTLTDGFPDQFGGVKGKKFMYKKMKELLCSIASETMAQQKEILLQTLKEWKGPLEQVDDITVIGIRV